MTESALPITANPPSDSHDLPKIKFKGSDRFVRELRKRVDAYFERTGRRRRDCPQMYFKTATILAWFAAAYFLLLFVATSWWTVLPLAIVLGVCHRGHRVQHPARWRAQGLLRSPVGQQDHGPDARPMGGSSYLWDWKHNSIHHTYPNITGHDDDINIGFLGRLAPEQQRLPFHRLQGIYLWLLYGFLAIKWHFFDDFYNIAVGRIGGHKIPRPKGKDLVVFIAGKVVFFSPGICHPDAAAPGLGGAGRLRHRGIFQRRGA